MTTTGTRGPYRTGVRTRARVVEAAMEAFGRHGYRGATVQVIAEAAGMSPAGVIRLFGSKEQLMRAVVDHWDVESNRIAREAGDHGLAFLRAMPLLLRAHAEHRPLLEMQARLLVEAAEPEHPAHEQIVQRFRTVGDLFAVEILRAGADGEIAPLSPQEAAEEARVLMAIMDGIQQQWLLDPEVDMAAAFSRHLERWVLGLSRAR
jgi:AcrR family transcriptional regulator